MKAKQSAWSKGWHLQKARYPLLALIPLYSFLGLILHDGSIYATVESGEADINTLNQLYFSSMTADQLINWMRALLIIGATLIGYAIFIRIAQWHYNQHSIS